MLTPWNVNRLGLGTYKIDKGFKTILRAAVKLGIEFFDTGDSYNHGESERMIGEVMKPIRKKVIISTKFHWEGKTLTYRDVKRCCEKSLKRLQTNYLDIYQLHWPNPYVPYGDIFMYLFKLRVEGKILRIGSSNTTRKERGSACQSEIIQNECNILMPIPKLGSRQILVAYKPMNGGTLPPYALAWVLESLPCRTIAIFNTRNINHLHENVKYGILRNRAWENTIKPVIKQIKIGDLDVPDPRDSTSYLKALATHLETYGMLKPIKVHRRTVVDGVSRYWAWYFAYGNTKIPCLMI